MPNRSSKQKSASLDVNQLARFVVSQAAGETSGEYALIDGKNAAAVALGRLGGLKGGKARARKLTKRRRQEIARKAALARWTAAR